MDRTTWDVRNLLEVFSREFTHKDFCLAHLFTDIKFEGKMVNVLCYIDPTLKEFNIKTRKNEILCMVN